MTCPFLRSMVLRRMRVGCEECERLRPNKRLKLAGADRFKGSGGLCPGGARTSSNDLAPEGESPALKRDPLGGTRYDTSSVLDRRVTMTRRSRLNVTLWILAAALPFHAACSRQEPRDQKAVTAAINDLWSRYMSSLNSGDIDRWMSLWADSGVQMPPNEPPVIGKCAMRARKKGGLDRF